MATKSTFKLTGFGELEQKLKTLGPRVARRVGGTAVKKSAAPIVDMAKILVPVDTGVLEDSITAVSIPSRPEDQIKVAIGFRKTASWRAHFVEFGTSKVAAQPFMRPALDSKAQAAISIMGAEMWKGIESEATKKA